MKKLFWKTYRAKLTNKDRSQNQYIFYRGFTWEVVQMAIKKAEENTEKEKVDWILEELIRIY